MPRVPISVKQNQKYHNIVRCDWLIGVFSTQPEGPEALLQQSQVVAQNEPTYRTHILSLGIFQLNDCVLDFQTPVHALHQLEK